MWVADDEDDKIYAYNLDDKARAPGKDFDTLNAAGNRDPEGIWSDGETMWVADRRGQQDLRLQYGRPDAGLRQGLQHPERRREQMTTEGIWSDGETMWVADTVDEKALRLQHDPPDAGVRQGIRYPGRRR